MQTFFTPLPDHIKHLCYDVNSTYGGEQARLDLKLFPQVVYMNGRNKLSKTFKSECQLFDFTTLYYDWKGHVVQIFYVLKDDWPEVPYDMTMCVFFREADMNTAMMVKLQYG